MTKAEELSSPQPPEKSDAGTKEQGDMFFYLDAAGEQHGPCLAADLNKLHAAGTLNSESYVYKVGDENWQTYSVTFPTS